MKLYYYQPDGHGPASFFVAAESKEAAVEAINAYRQAQLSSEHYYGGAYYYGSEDLTASDIQEADAGQLIENAND